jgi:beta-glucosidase
MDLIERSARIAATEASADGINWTFSPMLDLSRDPRWGRISEGNGEDTYLSSRIARRWCVAIRAMILLLITRLCLV